MTLKSSHFAFVTSFYLIGAQTLESMGPLSNWCGYSRIKLATYSSNSLTQVVTISTDYLDYFGNTALIQAAQNKNTECVEILLKAGADPTIPNKFNKSALFYIEEHQILKNCDLNAYYEMLSKDWVRLDVPSIFFKYDDNSKMMGAYIKLVFNCERLGWKVIDNRYLNMTTHSVDKWKKIRIVITTVKTSLTDKTTNSFIKLDIYHARISEDTQGIKKLLPDLYTKVAEVLQRNGGKMPPPYVNPCAETYENTDCFVAYSPRGTGGLSISACPRHHRIGRYEIILINLSTFKCHIYLFGRKQNRCTECI